MMRAARRVFLLSVLIVACRQTSANRDSTTTRSPSLVGTWRAADFINPNAADSAGRHPLGYPPHGYLVYDVTGHVFFQVTNGLASLPELRGRWQQADSATLRTLLADAAAYFGTYRVDYNAGSVVHRIEGEIPPNLGNTEVATPFRLHGDSLQLGRDSSIHWVFLRVRLDNAPARRDRPIVYRWDDSP
jgi:Lipocalin-like domain